MFAIWAAECVFVPINYKLHPREMEQILDDAGVAQVFASPKIAAELASVDRRPDRDHRRPKRTQRAARRMPSDAAEHRSRRHWRGCSTPAEPPAGRRARCCRTAT